MAKKEFTYHGKTLGELKEMSLQDLAKLVPARKRRALTRGFTDSQKKLLKKIEATNQGTYKKRIKTHCRGMIILPNMVDLKINIHNGKEYVQIEIQPEMIGHRLGEFAETRKRLKHSAPGIGATKSSAHQSVK
ncbi:30S ribosomal protein S19 [archaeon]|nr:30S ribosomal protein S19 [archaeon]